MRIGKSILFRLVLAFRRKLEQPSDLPTRHAVVSRDQAMPPWRSANLGFIAQAIFDGVRISTHLSIKIETPAIENYPAFNRMTPYKQQETSCSQNSPPTGWSPPLHT